MATKAEELKALEQIADIIEKVGGDDSYIGKAFEGCYIMAKDNIENDFWNSWKDKAENYQEKAEDWKGRFDAANEDTKARERTVVALMENLDAEQKKVESWVKIANKTNEKYLDLQNHCADKERKVATLEDEIIRLKAMLYDLMVVQDK